MSNDVLRTWRTVSIEEVSKHMLNVGDLVGNCENCKELGLEYATVKQCPRCGNEFKYVTSKNASGSLEGRFHVVKRFLAQRQDLIFVDYDDFKKVYGRDKAKKFFAD